MAFPGDSHERPDDLTGLLLSSMVLDLMRSYAHISYYESLAEEEFFVRKLAEERERGGDYAVHGRVFEAGFAAGAKHALGNMLGSAVILGGFPGAGGDDD